MVADVCKAQAEREKTEKTAGLLRCAGHQLRFKGIRQRVRRRRTVSPLSSMPTQGHTHKSRFGISFIVVIGKLDSRYVDTQKVSCISNTEMWPGDGVPL